VWIVQHLPYPSEKLGRPFQITLNACILSAAERMRDDPLPPLYSFSRHASEPNHIIYMPEPWSGSGVEEFADPWTVVARGWMDCDDGVIFRAAELVAAGLPAHARILRLKGTARYHTQVARDFDGQVEDPSLERLGKPWLFPSR
jgi:hypothetical protein